MPILTNLRRYIHTTPNPPHRGGGGEAEVVPCMIVGFQGGSTPNPRNHPHRGVGRGGLRACTIYIYLYIFIYIYKLGTNHGIWMDQNWEARDMASARNARKFYVFPPLGDMKNAGFISERYEQMDINSWKKHNCNIVMHSGTYYSYFWPFRVWVTAVWSSQLLATAGMNSFVRPTLSGHLLRTLADGERLQNWRQDCYDQEISRVWFWLSTIWLFNIAMENHHFQ